MKKTIYLIDTENVGSAWKALLERMNRQDQLLLFYTENSPGISYADLQLLLNSGRTFEFIPCHTGKNGLDFQLISYLGYLQSKIAKNRLVVVSDDTGYDPALQFWTDKGFLAERLSKADLRQEERVQPSVKRADSAVVSVAKTAPLPKAERKNDRHAVSSCAKPRKTVRQRPVKPAALPETSIPRLGDHTSANASDDAKSQMLLAVSGVLPDCQKGDCVRISQILEQHTYRQKQEIHYELVKAFGEDVGVKQYRRLRPHLYDLYQSVGA